MLDAHCHLDLYPDPLAVARESETHGVVTIAVTNLPSHFALAYPYLRRFKNVRPALGLHPLLAAQHKAEREAFRQLLSQTSYIGEVGLDFSPAGRDTRALQLESLRFVFHTIRDRPRFVSLHTRGAESAVLELLQEFAIARAVFHWYTGPLATLAQAMEQGHYVSVNPAMVRSKRGRTIVEAIPPERVLTESDGPHVRWGHRAARPTDIRRVLTALQAIWQVTQEEVEAQVRANFKYLVSFLRR